MHQSNGDDNIATKVWQVGFGVLATQKFIIHSSVLLSILPHGVIICLQGLVYFFFKKKTNWCRILWIFITSLVKRTTKSCPTLLCFQVLTWDQVVSSRQCYPWSREWFIDLQARCICLKFESRSSIFCLSRYYSYMINMKCRSWYFIGFWIG